MHSLSKLVAVAASCLVMISGSAIPLDTTPPSELLDKRADLQTCPGIDNKLVRSKTFRVRCNYDTLGNGNRQEYFYAQDFDECMAQCAGKYKSWCKYVSREGKINDPGNCYVKAGNGNGPGDSGEGYYVSDSRAQGNRLGIRQ